MRKPFSLIIILIMATIFIFFISNGESIAYQNAGKGKGGGVAEVYKQRCANCHREDGKGLETLQPPDFTNANWQVENTDKALAESIRNGKGVMPAFKEILTPAQVTSMVRYVRGFSTKATKGAKK